MGACCSEHELSSGFLVVKRFEEIYRAFAANPKFTMPIYALPLFGTKPEHASVRYLGIDREALGAHGMKGPFFEKYDTLGQIRLTELMGDWRNLQYWELVPSHEQALDVLGWQNQETPGVYEIVWARRAHATDGPPPEFVCLGFEPTYFTGDHFSVICDSMFFPRWHGTDPNGVLFREYFQRLNANGLFESEALAAEFLAYYLSFDWTEHGGDYDIASVWAPKS